MRNLTMSSVLLAAAMGCAASEQSQPQAQVNTLTEVERTAGWRLLFDGKTAAGWRGYRKDSVPPLWQVVEGALTRVGSGDSQALRLAQVRQQEGPLGGDIITTEQFADFELALEWKIAPGGNSGIMYRVTEEYDESYKSGPEMQVLDDSAHADGQDRLTSAGSNYALNAAPAGVVKRAGEWNAVRILVKGNHVEHWLNGQKVVEYELMSPDWVTRVKQSKFAEWPGYGRAAKGHIALQDHGDWVAYRNIKIRTPN